MSDSNSNLHYSFLGAFEADHKPDLTDEARQVDNHTLMVATTHAYVPNSCGHVGKTAHV